MSLRERIIEYIDGQTPIYRKIALDIHANPEVSNHEFFACKTLSEQLRREGFDVTVGVAGHRTGFIASRKSVKPGPVLVFLAEYDALAGLGHGCGHNLFGAGALLAAAALKQIIDETGGEVRVYGTPGEEGGENGSAKGSFVREGYLKDVDAALCAHPDTGPHTLTDSRLACAPVDIEFWGRAAHASSAPENGLNALDGLILTYNGINALRQHLTPDVRVHGIIVNGGDAPNIVPAYAKAKFYIRAATRARRDEVYRKVEAIVSGAALMTGTKGRMQPYQNLVDDMVITSSFDAVFAREMEFLGEKIEASRPGPKSSSDVGNISQVVPTIQPNLSINAETLPAHSEEFKAAACSEYGLRFVPLAAKSLALTALDLLLEPETLAAIKEEHKQKVAGWNGAIKAENGD
ncbi:MAG: M20 family metallopeptidase [Synergistaceae bacterium]|nr:M20 family metallopeptidase [Synergistaceae bacterium]